MAGRQNSSKPANSRRRMPAVNEEAREKQLISLAIDAAEQDLLSQNPSRQIVLHYLKLATTKTQLEKEKLRKENLLLEAKTSTLESQERSEELYRKAIEAMVSYSGVFRQGGDSEIVEDIV